MANGTTTPAERPPDYKSQGEQVGIGLTEPAVLSRVGKASLSWLQELVAWILEYLLKNAGRIVVFFAKSLARGEDKADPVFRELTDAAVKDLIGADARQGHAAVGRQMLDAMTGGSGGATVGNLQPSMAGAEAFMETVMKLALEGYLEGSLFHALSLGYLEKFGELDDILARVLGVERASRAVMRPLLSARVVTPTTWQVNRTYRPTLLSASEVARQVTRGRWAREKGIEELARQGYSDDRIEALLAAQAKYFTASDVRTFVNREHWTRERGIQHLKDQGYEEDQALDALRLEGLRTIEQLESQEANAVIGAYVARDIERGEFLGLLGDVVSPAADRALLTELADIRRSLNIRRLSSSQVEAAVKAGILATIDYRRALEREGYPPDDVTVLELLLRHELDREAAIATLRERQAEDRAAEKAARDAAIAARKAEIEAERRLARRGAESDLEAAVIRGLIPMARLEEVYAARYDADTVEVLTAIVEEQRLERLDQAARRAEAEQRAGRRNIQIGDIEAAVMANVLTIDEYRARLASLGFDAPDVAVLTATLAAQKTERDAATRQRAEAASRAAKRSINLGSFEQLVRRGRRTLAQYDELLAGLGFDDAARAGMRELLELKLEDDAAAAREREEAEKRLRTKGLSLEQFRRGVLLDIKTVADYEAFLRDQGFTPDAQLVLLAELHSDLEQAEAARRRREGGEEGTDASRLPLATLRRAARLGVVDPTTYLARLEAEGYAPDELDIELELLLLEIGEVQAQRRTREQAEQQLQLKGLSLSTLEAAVKLGTASPEDYRARALALGFDATAVTLLMTLLAEELAGLDDARRRRREINEQLTPRGVSIAEIEEPVRAGLRTVEQFMRSLTALGFSVEDAELLASLLIESLTKAAGGTGDAGG
jgi:hypothetical protein